MFNAPRHPTKKYRKKKDTKGLFHQKDFLPSWFWVRGEPFFDKPSVVHFDEGGESGRCKTEEKGVSVFDFRKDRTKLMV
jgi:hypothetical protein